MCRINVIVLSAIVFLLIPSPSQAKYSGGTGSPENPYRIGTAEDLNDIGNHEGDWDKCFVLVNDINLVDYTGTQFNIIGYYTSYYEPNKPFTGVFDGNGHSISNFTYDCNKGYVGLFAYVSSSAAEIKDLTLVDPNVLAGSGRSVGALVGWLQHATIAGCVVSGGNVSGYRMVGGLVGENRYGVVSDCNCVATVTAAEYYAGALIGLDDGSVSNCHCRGIISATAYAGGMLGGHDLGSVYGCTFTGTVSTRGSYAGGITGINRFRGALLRCSSSGSVSGPAHVGGITGGNSGGMTSDGIVEGCFSASTVEGGWTVGGLVGLNKAIVSDCYATGDVLGEDVVGGLVGKNGSSITTHGRIFRCYSAGTVSGTTSVGGLVGVNDSDTVSASFWDLDSSGEPNSDGGTGLTTAQMQTGSTFTDAGWDFVGESINGTEDIWRMCVDGVSYPLLWYQFSNGDFLCPDGVDLVDYSFLADHWGDTDCSTSNDCDRTDLDFSGAVDWADVKIFCDHFLEGF
jgi:hypothetical protein